jgi:hypothetical protein
VFKSSTAKILIIVLFLKIMLLTKFDDIFIPQNFLTSFRLSHTLQRHSKYAAAHLLNRCSSGLWTSKQALINIDSYPEDRLTG